jgi:hypothetical protein
MDGCKPLWRVEVSHPSGRLQDLENWTPTMQDLENWTPTMQDLENWTPTMQDLENWTPTTTLPESPS